MAIKMHVKKGDKVEVISGNNKGKSGEVIAVFPEKNRVKIKDLAMVVKHKRIDRQNNTGGMTKEEGTIHASNVKLVERKDKVK